MITPQDDLVFRGTGEVISTNVSIKDAVKAVATMPRTANIPKNVLAQIDVDRERASLNKDGIDPRVRSLALSVAGDSRVKYNLSADAVPKDNDASAFFLFESKEGYCDLFATTMVNMARSVDLPARFVLGYLITPGPADANGFTTVRSKDYHAWAEIYFEGYGWIPFDPTEGAEAVPGFGVGSTMNPGFQLTDEALRVIGIAFVVLALIVPLVFFAGRSFLRGMGGTARKHGELLRHHSKFQRILEQTSGKPKRFSHTLPEYTKFISDTLDVNAGEAHAIAGAFDSAFFAPEEPDQESIKKLGERVASFRETLRHARPTSS